MRLQWALLGPKKTFVNSWLAMSAWKTWGMYDLQNPELGETFLNLTEHYIRLWSEERKKLVIWVRVTADNHVLLMKPLEDILRINSSLSSHGLTTLKN